MTDIVSAIYDLMGKVAEPSVDEDTVKEKVDRIFQVFSVFRLRLLIRAVAENG